MPLIPHDIQFLNPFDLSIAWNDGHKALYHSRSLRLACPCASCIDEFTRQKTLRDDMVPQDVRPLNLDYIGKYALAIKWSDGHSTGYFTFEHLRQMCECEGCLEFKKSAVLSLKHQ